MFREISNHQTSGVDNSVTRRVADFPTKGLAPEPLSQGPQHPRQYSPPVRASLMSRSRCRTVYVAQYLVCFTSMGHAWSKEKPRHQGKEEVPQLLEERRHHRWVRNAYEMGKDEVPYPAMQLNTILVIPSFEASHGKSSDHQLSVIATTSSRPRRQAPYRSSLLRLHGSCQNSLG